MIIFINIGDIIKQLADPTSCVTDVWTQLGLFVTLARGGVSKLDTQMTHHFLTACAAALDDICANVHSLHISSKKQPNTERPEAVLKMLEQRVSMHRVGSTIPCRQISESAG